jgi:DNA-binding NtrC family response regulator
LRAVDLRGGAQQLENRMAKAKTDKSAQRILLADEDVIVRFGIAQYLRDCGLSVLEAATSHEAKAILQALTNIDVLISDPQFAGPESGFALAQWVRRNRPGVHVILEASLEGKTAAAFELCGAPDPHKTFDAQTLATKIRTMRTEQRRRAKPQQSAATSLRRRRN